MVAHCNTCVTLAGLGLAQAHIVAPCIGQPCAAMPKLSAEQALKKAADLRAKAAIIANKGLMDQVVHIMKGQPADDPGHPELCH